MSEQTTSNQVLKALVAVGSAAGGWTLSQYCGASIWIPGGATVLLILLFTKTSFRPKAFQAAVAVTGGQVVWFFAGLLLSRAWLAVGFDLAALIAGVIWLALRPSVGATLYLGSVQLLCLVINVVSLVGMSFGSTEHRALTAHIVFRVIAIVCLAVEFWHWKRPPNPPAIPAMPAIAPESRR